MSAHLASRRFPSSLEGPGLSPFHSPMERQYYRCVLVCVGVCWPTWHLGDPRLRRRVLVSPFHSPMERQYYRCVWMCVGVGVGVCWCVCFVCVGPPGISEIPVFVGGSRSLTIPLTNGEAVLQVCVGVGVCVGVCWCVSAHPASRRSPSS